MVIYMECTLNLLNNQVFVEGDYEMKTSGQGTNYVVLYDNIVGDFPPDAA